jgi:N-acetylglucosaminyl-diphospho-decaprenol L-rhamnosyltransferase
MQLDLAIVIVSYNTRDFLRDCLDSIFASHGDFAYKVCVVDNNSSDASAAMVREMFPQVHLIERQVNSGYAYANNLGLRAVGFDASQVSNADYPRYLLLLNPDTIVPPFALREMLAFMEAHPEAGAAGPRLVLPNGELDRACRRSFPTPEVAFYRLIGLSFLFPRSRRFGRYNLGYLDPSETTEVDSVVGAFMMARGKAVQQAGLLDENFFMYGEDLDWAKRIKDAGWKVYYHSEVVVHHVKRAASRHSPRAQIEFNRAMRIFYDKHYVHQTPWWLHGLVVLGIGLRGRLERARQALRSRRDGAPAGSRGKSA